MKRAKQERELTEDERNIVISVRHCTRELDDILQGARRKSQSNARIFAESGISFMFRGMESYADMYEKLGIKSRDALERSFQKYAECEKIQDTRDTIDETEGNWNNYLKNLNDDMIKLTKNSNAHDIVKSNPICDYIYLPSISLIDCQTNREFDLNDFVHQHTCVFVTCQPAYWPDTTVLWRHSEINKAKCDLAQFNMGHIVITWGPADCVRTWSKQVTRLTKWKVLWDKSNEFCSKFNFKSGLQHIWAAENLDFCGCHRVVNRYIINKPPSDFNWFEWRQIGGELILSTPVSWDPKIVYPTLKEESNQTARIKQRYSKSSSDDDDDDDQDNKRGDANEVKKIKSFVKESLDDKKALDKHETKVCKLYRSSYLAYLMPSGLIYQAALTCYARLHNTTESEVMDKIRRDRRFRTAPESDRLQYEATSGLYYDPETAMYYDSARGYFYDASNHMYYYWSQSENRYISANALIQAEMVASQTAEVLATQATNRKAMIEREAAKQAGHKVAAQLAEIQASKDEYAAYVYATCVLPQRESIDPNYADLSHASNQTYSYQNTTAGAKQIETYLNDWSGRPQSSYQSLVPYTDDVTDETVSRSSTPPPPGL